MTSRTTLGNQGYLSERPGCLGVHSGETFLETRQSGWARAPWGIRAPRESLTYRGRIARRSTWTDWQKRDEDVDATGAK
jgi:hypothetical protein